MSHTYFIGTKGQIFLALICFQLEIQMFILLDVFLKSVATMQFKLRSSIPQVLLFKTLDMLLIAFYTKSIREML